MTPEVIEHVIDEHSEQIKNIRKSIHDTNNILSVVSVGLDQVRESLGKTFDGITNKLYEVTERLTTLEVRHDIEAAVNKDIQELRTDLTSRNAKKDIYKKIRSYWWAYILAISLMADIIAHLSGMDISVHRIESMVSTLANWFGIYGGHH